jgi:ribonuclease I
MKSIHILLSALLLALVFGQNYESQRQKFPDAKKPYSGSFAASWLGGFCFQSGKCDTQSLSEWDGESFTIHGLWPNPKGTKRYDDFDVDNIQDSNLLDDLDNYWPANSKPSDPERAYYWLWEHEYDKHGKEYTELLQAYKPNLFGKASTQSLQERFFRDAINFYKSQNLTKINISKANPKPETNKFGDLVVTKQQLSDIIGIDKENFIVSCGKGKDWIYEIQICLRFQEDLTITL